MKKDTGIAWKIVALKSLSAKHLICVPDSEKTLSSWKNVFFFLFSISQRAKAWNVCTFGLRAHAFSIKLP